MDIRKKSLLVANNVRSMVQSSKARPLSRLYQLRKVKVANARKIIGSSMCCPMGGGALIKNTKSRDTTQLSSRIDRLRKRKFASTLAADGVIILGIGLIVASIPTGLGALAIAGLFVGCAAWGPLIVAISADQGVKNSQRKIDWIEALSAIDDKLQSGAISVDTNTKAEELLEAVLPDYQHRFKPVVNHRF